MRLEKKFIVILFFCIIQIGLLFSNSWTYIEDSGRMFLKDETGKTCEIFSDITVTEDALARVETALNTLWSIPGLRGTQCRVNIEPRNYFHFILYPDSLVYKGVNFKNYLPSGLSFRYDSALFYDVTLKVEEFLPRISGAYISPNDFLEQLYAVYTMPELYLHGDVLLRRIERLEKALMAISKDGLFTKPTEVSDEIMLEVISLYKQNPSITINEAYDVLKEKGIEASKKDIEAVFMVYLGKFE